MKGLKRAESLKRYHQITNLIAARTIAASFVVGATHFLESVLGDHSFASKTKLDCGTEVILQCVRLFPAFHH